jgi:chromate transporter
MSDSAVPAPPFVRPSLTDLFRAFVMVSLSGFGGALPWARRMIVDKRAWMTAQEFNEAFALAQFLPGPNVINFSVVFGSRIGGAAGALRPLRRPGAARAGSFRYRLGGLRPADGRGRQDGGAVVF